jgi:archaeosine synthase
MDFGRADAVEDGTSGENGKRQRGTVYFPGVGRVHDYAVLHYMGADFLDSVQLVLAARDGTMLFPDGEVMADTAGANICPCPACTEFGGSGEKERGFLELCLHNYHAAAAELERITLAVRDGQFRTMVEQRCTASPELVTLLRLLDGEHFESIERDTPRIPAGGTGEVRIVTAQSLNRPDIDRYRRHISQDYRKPPSPDILLLLPCSARKPYSASRTHGRIREAMGMPGLERVHEVIVTSPMGLVPRELEMFPPVPYYDISVTGEWTADEERIILGMAEDYLRNNSYATIINHFDGPDDSGFLDGFLKGHCRAHSGVYLQTVSGRATGEKSLQRLREALESAMSVGDAGELPISARDRRREDMICRLDAQFGGAALAFGDDFRVAGRYPRLKMFDGEDRQLGTLTPERGLVSLTMPGAALLAASGRSCVEIDDFYPKGNLFAVGVRSATDDIRVGDEVVVTHDGETRACGVAQMSGREMGASMRGMAVSLRHRVKGGEVEK